MNEQTQGMNEQTDGTRCIEPESFVRDDAHLWHLLYEVLGYQRNQGVSTYEDGDLILRDALCQLVPDSLCQPTESLFLIVLCR